MLYQIAIENNFEGRSIAWALEHPGCFTSGVNANDALAAIPEGILDYAAWIDSRSGGQSWVDVSDIELLLADSFDGYVIDESYELAEDGYEVNAWFRFDWKPLTEQDVERGLKVLEWSRLDLLASAEGLSTEELEIRLPGQRWCIAGILQHVGGAEWWYLERLGLAFPREQVPADPWERLDMTRARLIEVLPTLVGSEKVVGIEGEFWSPRKLLRRAAWHERDHSGHIWQLRLRGLHSS